MMANCGQRDRHEDSHRYWVRGQEHENWDEFISFVSSFFEFKSFLSCLLGISPGPTYCIDPNISIWQPKKVFLSSVHNSV